MSPKNEVLPLNYLSLKYISTLLIHSLSNDEGLNYEPVREYLLDATNEVLQDLLKIILNTENLDASTRFTCLSIILREDIRKLDTGLFPHSYYQKILDVISVQGIGLQHLNLKGIWLRDYPLLLKELLGRLKNLKVLIIPHTPDDLVLITAMSCKYLTVLDVSGECNFTQNGLRVLKSEHLKVLSIGMYGKKKICEDANDNSTEIVIDLIKNLPNLNIFKTYSFTGNALKMIYKENKNYKTNLKYIHDTETDLETLRAISHLCPDLESVNLNAPDSAAVCNLGLLKRLISLKISEPNLNDLFYYFETSRNNLNTLKVSGVRGGSLDLSQVALYIPELKTLDCYKTHLISLNLDNYFINLENLEILYCDVSDSVVKYLLRNSPFLKRIVVGDVIRMTDGDVFRLCAECEFLSLEELWFSYARGLTVTSVELLMGHCPNLKVLGQVSGWDVTPNDLDYLKAVILSTNTDLTLLPLET